jgi:methionyl-tRNA formyltransferase
MKIGFFGNGPWALRALEALARNSDYKIVFVVERFPENESRLAQLAVRLGIPALCPQNVNAPDVVEHIRALGADLHASMSYDQILRPPILDVPNRGTLNCHAGALPFYRGRNPLTWAIINGESEFGVTVHWVDSQIDTGDIVLQQRAPIAEADDFATLLRKAYDLCADTLVRAISLVFAGRDTRKPQAEIDSIGLYCCRRRPGDEQIAWGERSQFIHNFVRALVPPGPGARTWHDERAYAILKTELVPNARAYIGVAGEVVGRSTDDVLVKTGDSILRICSWAPIELDGQLGISSVPRVPRGVRLGQDIAQEIATLRSKVADLEHLITRLSRTVDKENRPIQ